MKILEWLLKFTKVGKAAGKVQDVLEGKKQMLAGLATGVAGTVTILANFADQGIPYLLHVAGTSEFLAASGGWIAFFNALKGEKTRKEIAAIAEKGK